MCSLILNFNILYPLIDLFLINLLALFGFMPVFTWEFQGHSARIVHFALGSSSQNKILLIHGIYDLWLILISILVIMIAVTKCMLLLWSSCILLCWILWEIFKAFELIPSLEFSGVVDTFENLLIPNVMNRLGVTPQFWLTFSETMVGIDRERTLIEWVGSICETVSHSLAMICIMVHIEGLLDKLVGRLDQRLSPLHVCHTWFCLTKPFSTIR